jgi:hypothetical protein
VLKLAHAGLLTIVKRRVVPLSGSLAVGRNEYTEPTYTQLAGVPEIVGAAAYAPSGASNTAKSERTAAIVGTRTARARVFLIKKGMRIPSRVTTCRLHSVARDAARTRTPKISVPPDSILVGHRMHEACRCDGLLTL